MHAFFIDLQGFILPFLVCYSILSKLKEFNQVPSQGAIVLLRKWEPETAVRGHFRSR